ncbi:NADH dehydrogenase 1 alpha subcomplex assembly factor 3 [Pavlovales sp. CCMP2436]|nr:NADH dehydrogenase 1 alpha subcomplex assembly factor 3 [Pavlovales sp. CCMP2436]|mmetsp:Transcript_42818/g.99217  ORF Transcript_42818/g.99217 Transcript_42818/m.99217 type:complete len:178 (+) Transcript_42818:34-567(+)
MAAALAKRLVGGLSKVSSPSVRFLSSGRRADNAIAATRSEGEGGYGVDLLAKIDTSDHKRFMLINSYFSNGFKVAGLQLAGSVCISPQASFLWNTRSLAEITAESLSFIPLLEPSIDIVVIGCGRRVEQLDPSVRRFLDKERISLEVQTSPNACATFNFLNQESRSVLALLLPLEQS